MQAAEAGERRKAAAMCGNAFRLFAASGYVREEPQQERQKRGLVLSGREKNGGQVVGTEITFEGTHVLVISFLVPRPEVREEW